MTIPEQLIAARRKSGLSVRAAARLAGVSYVWLCKCERGHVSPTVEYVAKMATAYGVTFRIEPDSRPAAPLIKGTRKPVRLYKRTGDKEH